MVVVIVLVIIVVVVVVVAVVVRTVILVVVVIVVVAVVVIAALPESCETDREGAGRAKEGRTKQARNKGRSLREKGNPWKKLRERRASLAGGFGGDGQLAASEGRTKLGRKDKPGKQRQTMRRA